jgi:ribonuclease III
LDKTATWLKKSLDYEFKNVQLLQQALTHRSAHGLNNERLEYLGDAVLDFVISEAVYLQRPDATEGVLSRLRSSLVKDTTLAELATELEIGDYLILGPGEKKSGGHRRASILADALEAIFGAVYLDAGFGEAQQIIHNAFAGRLTEIPDSAERRDPKTRLQELVQSRKIALPDYRVERVEGKAHKQTFSVRCTIAELDASTTGQGTTRRNAEQESAAHMLALIEQAV